METHDGFTAQEWKEFALYAFEHGPYSQNWLNDRKPLDAISIHQFNQRRRATKKFSDVERWIWTAKLLEQSSDEKVAALTAAAFPSGVRVIDFCCGAGSDAVALAGRGPIVAVDRCEIACELTRANVAMHFPKTVVAMTTQFNPSVTDNYEFEVVCTDAEAVQIPSDSWVHLDPDRRVGKRRTTQASYFQPGLDFISDLINRSAGGSIKLAPATKIESSHHRLSDRESPQLKIVRSKIGRQFVAWGGSVRQQRWWWNVAPYPPGTTTASIMTRTGEWHHWTVSDKEVGDCDDWSRIMEDWREIEGYVGDADGCVRAAGLHGLLADKLNASRIGHPLGFFMNAQQLETTSPWIDWFKIEATMPLDRKRLRAYLRERKIGVLEIKVRNVEIDPDVLRKEMKLQGSGVASILITRCGTKTIAIVCERIPSITK